MGGRRVFEGVADVGVGGSCLMTGPDEYTYFGGIVADFIGRRVRITVEELDDAPSPPPSPWMRAYRALEEAGAALLNVPHGDEPSYRIDNAMELIHKHLTDDERKELDGR